MVKVLRYIWNTWWLCLLVGIGFWGLTALYYIQGNLGDLGWIPLLIGCIFMYKGSGIGKFIFGGLKKGREEEKITRGLK